MPALGATFGVLIALTLAGEAGYLKAAQDTVAGEAAAAARLAWAATSPGVEAEPIHLALGEYLQATRASEWRDGPAADGDPGVAETIAALERTVRTEAARTELGTPASTELLASLDAVTSSRRQRIADASRHIPVLYVVTLVAERRGAHRQRRRARLPQPRADVAPRRRSRRGRRSLHGPPVLPRARRGADRSSSAADPSTP